MPGKRLSVCAGFVKGDKACDVGTDHGYLAVELLLSGKCSRVIASDINEKPLAAAWKTLEKHGLTDKAELILSDGLKSVPLDGVTDIVIAGMGGELIFSILSECGELAGRNLILQPMTQANFLRKHLAENGFDIIAERAVSEGKHVYTVINAVYDGIKRPCGDLSGYAGALDPRDSEARIYISRQAEKLYKAASGLKTAGELQAAAEKTSLSDKLMNMIGEKTMLKASDIFAEMDRIAPFSNTQKGDNSGLLVGNAETEVTKALTALDITCDVVREAEAKGANVIVAHHPVIYNPLYVLDESNPACLALKKGIVCICFHSPLDLADGGINDMIYDMLTEPFGLLKPERALEPVSADGRGYGIICGVSKQFSPAETAEKLKEIFGCTVVRYTNGYRPIKKLAFCSGGAGSALPFAMKLGADAFISGDLKHDQLITALNNGVSVFDCGHYHTEVIAMKYLKKRFNEDLPSLSFEIAESCTDPSSYAL